MSQNVEKGASLHVAEVSTDHGHSSGSSAVEAREHPNIDVFTSNEQRKIMRRVDLRLVTTLGLLYSVSLMDRTNLGNVAIAGMSKDLRLDISPRYSVIVLVFFITYTIFQPPSVVLLRKINPRNFLAGITLSWGAIMIGCGFVETWKPLIGLRIILGALEAGFFASCVYILSTFYTRYELQKRNAAFYVVGTLVSAFTGILAYGIAQMNGTSGLRGWRWIFIIEGLISIAAALIGYLVIVDFPEKSATSWRFLTVAEARFVTARIQLDRKDVVVEPFHWASFLRTALDTKILGFALLFGFTTINTYAISYFMPLILRDGLGFSLAESLILVAPPYATAALVMFGEGIIGDRYHCRAPIIITNCLIGVLGLALLGFANNSSIRYFGIFLATISCNSNVPAILTYQANNIRGQWKRAMSSAVSVGTGGIGGIIGTSIFRAEDAPNYIPGLMGCMIAFGLMILVVLLLTLKFWRANKAQEIAGLIIEGLEGFRYTY